MTLRARIAAVAGLAVAVAVLVAAVAVYLAVRSELRGEVDRSLRQRAAAFVAPPPTGTAGAAFRGGPPRGEGDGRGDKRTRPTADAGGDTAHASTVHGSTVQASTARVSTARLSTASGGNDGGSVNSGSGRGGPMPGRGGPGGPEFPNSVQPLPLGGPSGYVQFVTPAGAVHVPGGQGSSRAIALDASDRRIASSGNGSSLSDRRVGTTRLRVLTLGTGGQGAVMVARPLGEVERELRHVLLILAIVGICGIAIAAALGALVARAALAPIARFTRRTETLAGALAASERLPERGRDELARLARSFNATLDALERSVAAQRNLVADASHELRTPIASLRANIQVLAEADRLPPTDQEALRADIVGELDELTRLVEDVVELARGGAAEGPRAPTRLDELVAAAVQRARRRGDLDFELRLEPTTIDADAARVDRALANLLDNARKWSTHGAGPTAPPGGDGAVTDGANDGGGRGGPIEVDLREGILSVRDHGPGFREPDLPHVFERFYRARDARSLPGSGLGLAIVRQTAEAHGGWVSAENAVGGGAMLRVSFGAQQSPPADLAAPDAP